MYVQDSGLWEDSMTDEAIGVQGGYEQIYIVAWSIATMGGGWVAKDGCVCGLLYRDVRKPVNANPGL